MPIEYVDKRCTTCGSERYSYGCVHDNLCDSLCAAHERLAARDTEIERLRKALGWYGDERRYWSANTQEADVLRDRGQRARAALAMTGDKS